VLVLEMLCLNPKTPARTAPALEVRAAGTAELLRTGAGKCRKIVAVDGNTHKAGHIITEYTHKEPNP
jgi:hypothetical protein